jgi:hypothetical protein
MILFEWHNIILFSRYELMSDNPSFDIWPSTVYGIFYILYNYSTNMYYSVQLGNKLFEVAYFNPLKNNFKFYKGCCIV